MDNIEKFGITNSERTKCEVWTRVMGYHRPISSFNIGKKGEVAERKYFDEKKCGLPCDHPFIYLFIFSFFVFFLFHRFIRLFAYPARPAVFTYPVRNFFRQIERYALAAFWRFPRCSDRFLFSHY